MTIEAEKGMSIYHAAQQAVDSAQKQGAEVTLRFNGEEMHVSPFSWADDIATIYFLKRAERSANTQVSQCAESAEARKPSQS